MTHVVVIGGGIAGVEAALTLRLALPGCEVVLIASSSTLRLLPNLVYVPFGVEPATIDQPLADPMRRLGVDLVVGTCRAVGADGTAVLDDGRRLKADAIVLAPGTVAGDACSLRTLEDALDLRRSLAGLDQLAGRRSIELWIDEDASWTAPAYELAVLADGWLRARNARERTDLTVCSSERCPVQSLGRTAGTVIAGELTRRDIGVGSTREGADMVIRVGRLRARVVPGVPCLAADGFYQTDGSGRVDTNMFVVGDATSTPVKAGFVAAWHARRVAAALGGDLSRLGGAIVGVDLSRAEYQFDAADETIVFALDMACLEAGTDPVRSVARSDSGPDKLRGTLVHQLLLAPSPTAPSPAIRFHDDLRTAQHALLLTRLAGEAPARSRP